MYSLCFSDRMGFIKCDDRMAFIYIMYWLIGCWASLLQCIYINRSCFLLFSLTLFPSVSFNLSVSLSHSVFHSQSIWFNVRYVKAYALPYYPIGKIFMENPKLCISCHLRKFAFDVCSLFWLLQCRLNSAMVVCSLIDKWCAKTYSRAVHYVIYVCIWIFLSMCAADWLWHLKLCLHFIVRQTNLI